MKKLIFKSIAVISIFSLILFVTLPTQRASAAIALVSNRIDALGRNGGTSGALNTTGADFIVIVQAFDNNDGGDALSDSKGNTWNVLTKRGKSGDGGVRIFYAINPTVGSGHTFTITGSDNFSQIAIAAFSGSKLTLPFDVENGLDGFASVTTVQPGNVTPSEDNELVITGLEFFSSTASIDSGFTITDQGSGGAGAYYGGALAYKIQTTAASVNPTWTITSQTASAVIATFKSAAAAPATTQNSSTVAIKAQIFINGKISI